MLDNATVALNPSTDDEVINMAVRVMLTREVTRAQLAKDLCVRPSTLDRWLSEAISRSPYGDVLESLFFEVGDLRQENAMLRKIVAARQARV